MALEHLLAALERQAQDEARTALEDARKQAADIREALEARLAEKRRAVLERREVELRSEADAEISRRRGELRGEVLAARQDILDRVFEAARDLLIRIAGGKRSRSSQLYLLRLALSYMPDSGAVVRSPLHLTDAAADAVSNYDDVTVKPDAELETGTVVEAADGSVRADATLARHMEALRPTLAIEIVRQLEGGDHGGVG